MVDGLWTIEFISTISRAGAGVIVLRDNRLLGGDNGYYYTGDYSVTNSIISGSVNVTRFNPLIISVFGDIDNFSLTFNGNLSEDDTIEGTASREGMPDLRIQIRCKKKEDF